MLQKEAGFSAEQVPVSTYGGSSKNLKDIKESHFGRGLSHYGRGQVKGSGLPGAALCKRVGERGGIAVRCAQGYLSHKKPPPRRNLQ